MNEDLPRIIRVRDGHRAFRVRTYTENQVVLAVNIAQACVICDFPFDSIQAVEEVQR